MFQPLLVIFRFIKYYRLLLLLLPMGSSGLQYDSYKIHNNNNNNNNSTPFGHLQVYKIWYRTGYFCCCYLWDPVVYSTIVIKYIIIIIIIIIIQPLLVIFRFIKYGIVQVTSVVATYGIQWFTVR